MLNDTLTILGFVIIVCVLMAGSFALGRWDRRETYTPGPPAQDLQPLVDSFLTRVTNKELETLRREMIGDGFTKLDPMSFVNIKMPEVEESVRLVPRYPSNPLVRRVDSQGAWAPPGGTYALYPDEQDYWINLLGDPTKKETD